MTSLKYFLEEASTGKMIGAIKNFIGLIEARNQANENYARHLHVALVALYDAGLHFKEIQLTHNAALIDDPAVDFADNNTALTCHFLEELRIRNTLFKKTFGQYTESNLGTIEQADLVHFNDSLRYMYKELKTQVFKIEHTLSNAMAEDGLWQIKNDFFTGWGKACAKAIALLHSFRY